MDHDYRNHPPVMYRGAAPAPSLYPRVGSSAAPPPDRTAPYLHPTSSAPPSSSAAGIGIKVVLKPQYQINPPQLAPQMPEIPRSSFQFDFEFEKQILAEAEKESQNWSRITSENQPSKPMSASSSSSSSSSMASTRDPVVDKYVASGLGREAVSLAVLNYGDNPVKVREFVKGYNILREMGFSSKNVAEALAIYDNDTDKAVAHFLNTSQ